MGRVISLLAFRVTPLVLVSFAIPGKLRLDVLVTLAFVTAWMVAEALIENFESNRAAVSSTQDSGSRRFILAMHLFSWWGPLCELFVHRTAISGARTVLGLSIIALGAIVRLSAVAHLGKYFTGHVRICDGQTVCSTGLYRFVRHPGYIGLTLLNLGPALAMGAWFAFAVVVIGTCAANAYRVAVEENLLREMLGNAYEEYCNVTPRWILRMRFDAGRTPRTQQGDTT